MELIHVLTMAGVLTAGAGVSAQEPPPRLPTQTVVPQSQTTPPAAPAAPIVVPLRASLTPQEVRDRREAIYLMEGLLIKAVNLAAEFTATEIRRVQPGLAMFSTAPVKAHGTFLEEYGVFFEVEIPSVIPSVASLLESLGRDRGGRQNTQPAQPAAVGGSSVAGASMDAMMNPDAHYVESVKQRLINAMVRNSNSLELRPDEWLTVAARDGSEAPGQVGQPSTMMLQIKGADLAEYFAGRITLEDVRRRVKVTGY
jgi:hypothetical protein